MSKWHENVYNSKSIFTTESWKLLVDFSATFYRKLSGGALYRPTGCLSQTAGILTIPWVILCEFTLPLDHHRGERSWNRMNEWTNTL